MSENASEKNDLKSSTQATAAENEKTPEPSASNNPENSNSEEVVDPVKVTVTKARPMQPCQKSKKHPWHKLNYEMAWSPEGVRRQLVERRVQLSPSQKGVGEWVYSHILKYPSLYSIF